MTALDVGIVIVTLALTVMAITATAFVVILTRITYPSMRRMAGESTIELKNHEATKAANEMHALAEPEDPGTGVKIAADLSPPEDEDPDEPDEPGEDPDDSQPDEEARPRRWYQFWRKREDQADDESDEPETDEDEGDLEQETDDYDDYEDYDDYDYNASGY